MSGACPHSGLWASHDASITAGNPKASNSFAGWTHLSSGLPTCFADDSKDHFHQNSLCASFETPDDKRSKERRISNVL
jgi:hypothetical protein